MLRSFNTCTQFTTPQQSSSVHFLLECADLVLQVADEAGQGVNIPTLLIGHFIDDHLRLPEFNHVFVLTWYGW